MAGLKTVVMALGALLCVAAAQAAPVALSSKVDVVKIMSFRCPVCYASEARDLPIARAAQMTGGQFVPAPVPSDEDSSGAAERVYYAARSYGSGVAEQVKRSLYKGMQDVGVPLNDYMSVYTWLQQDVPSLEPQMSELFQKAQDSNAKGSVTRAFRMAAGVGVQALPAYVILVDGQVVTMLDPTSVPGENLTVLKDEVIKKIQLYANPPTK